MKMRITGAKFRFRRTLGKLKRDQSGAAAVEFAFVLPMLVTLFCGGTETTNYVWTRQEVTQLALNTADHASRMSRANVLRNMPVTESEITDVLVGTALQGENIGILSNGRIIISSLQQNLTGGQWIAWQRCYGNSSFESSWGKEGKGLIGNSFPGMGPSSVKATPNEAVMFAEVAYEYTPLFPIFTQFVPDKRFSEVAAFNIRESRDLSQIYPVAGVTAKRC